MNVILKHLLLLIIQFLIIFKLWFIYSYWWGQVILALLSATTISGFLLVIIELIDYIKKINDYK
ncbi:hypothetical protein DYZ95_07465 [Apilactobacillus timberlakei]|nr:hypothetical protein DYZ95_07465 [Apilactobacillus timberlakei]